MSKADSRHDDSGTKVAINFIIAFFPETKALSCASMEMSIALKGSVALPGALVHQCKGHKFLLPGIKRPLSLATRNFSHGPEVMEALVQMSDLGKGLSLGTTLDYILRAIFLPQGA